ncbi:MAG: hypothetical protein AAFY60_12930, partial [Myxococcota bacterium]
SPLFHTAKAAMLARYTLRNRAPAPSFGNFRAMRAPREPYRPSTPFLKGTRSLWELPVADAWGAPLTGSALVALSDGLAEPLYRALQPREHVVLAFHAIELADEEEIPPSVASFHRELNVPWRTRQKALRRRLELLADGRTAVTCSELAARLT